MWPYSTKKWGVLNRKGIFKLSCLHESTAEYHGVANSNPREVTGSFWIPLDAEEVTSRIKINPQKHIEMYQLRLIFIIIYTYAIVQFELFLEIIPMKVILLQWRLKFNWNAVRWIYLNSVSDWEIRIIVLLK